MPSNVEVDGPDGNTYEFPAGTDKAAAIKYFKAKGIGAKATAITPPKMTVGAPSSQPMSKQYLATGSDVPEAKPGVNRTLESIGKLGGGAVESAGYMAAVVPTMIHRSLQKAGVMGDRSRLFPGEHTAQEVEKQDVPNAVAMVSGGMESGADEPAMPRGRTVPEPPKAAESLTPEQVEAIEKANRTYRAAKSQVEKRQGLEQASKDMTQKTFDNLHATHDTARGALDQRWGQFREAMEGAQLDPAEAYNNIEAAKAKYLKGSPASLTVFNNLAKELGIQEFIDEPGGTLKAIPGTGELPFDTARVHYSAIGDKLAQGNLPGNVYQALKAVEQGLDRQLTKAAESRNLGKDYQSLKANEHQFRSDWTDPKSPLARAYRSLDANYLEPHVLGRGNDYITKQLERYRQHGAQPHLPLAARRFAEQASEITKKVPEVKELPKPKPPTKGTGRLAHAVRRGAMKIAGGHVAGFPGYVAMGEADTALEESIRRRNMARGRTVPEPPDE